MLLKKMSCCQVDNEAFVTLATSDAYALGALVLSHSLKRVGTTRRLAVMITRGVSQPIRDQLLYAYDVIVQVDILDSHDTANLALLTRPDLGVTFTKLYCWRLTQFVKCVFMDADTLVLQNIDDLFEREELSAAPDIGWPDCFNSGVYVFRPSEVTYLELLQFAVTHGSFDGGDQGLLNLFFNDWATKDLSRHLPFVYNVVSQTFYSYLPAFKKFGKDVKVVHFIGTTKPWHVGYNTATGCVEAHGDTRHSADFLQLWWNIFMGNVHPGLDPSVTFLVNVFERHPPPPPPPPPPRAPTPPPFHHEPVHYEMTGPYIPPSIPQFYEEPLHHHAPQDLHEYHVVENKSDNRSYSHLECFYSEPPMTHEESYPRSETAYDAKEIVHQWTEFSKPEVSEVLEPEAASEDVVHGEDTFEADLPHHYEDSHHHPEEEEVYEKKDNTSHGLEISSSPAAAVDESPSSGGLAEENLPKSGLDDDPTPSRGSPVSDSPTSKLVDKLKSPLPSLSDAKVDSKAERVESLVREEVFDSSEVRVTENKGVVRESEVVVKSPKKRLISMTSELSNMKIFTKQQLDDTQRQYNWERGQIDYLGMDSFDNILKQLDKKIVGLEPDKPLEFTKTAVTVKQTNVKNLEIHPAVAMPAVAAAAPTAKVASKRSTLTITKKV